MPFLYLNGNKTTKELSGCRRQSLPSGQLGNTRAEVQINNEHSAYSDPERLDNYKLNADNTEIIAKT